MERGYCDEGATTEVKATEPPTAIAVRSERAQSVNMDTVNDGSSSDMDNGNSEEHWTTNPQTHHKSSAISPTNSTQQEPGQISCVTSANTSNRSVRREVCERLCGGSGGGEGKSFVRACAGGST